MAGGKAEVSAVEKAGEESAVDVLAVGDAVVDGSLAGKDEFQEFGGEAREAGGEEDGEACAVEPLSWRGGEGDREPEGDPGGPIADGAEELVPVAVLDSFTIGMPDKEGLKGGVVEPGGKQQNDDERERDEEESLSADLSLDGEEIGQRGDSERLAGGLGSLGAPRKRRPR